MRPDQYPFVSVIITTKNEEKYIGKLLESLVLQTYPKDKFEVLVIDALSNDLTLHIINTYKKKLNLKIVSICECSRPQAWNIGIDNAQGNYFIIVNAHSFLKEDYIEKAVNTFFKLREVEPKLAAVGCKLTYLYENIFSKMISLLYSSFFSGANTARYTKKPHFSDTATFALYDKQIVVENGKFDEDFLIGEDYELSWRLRLKGYKLYTNPEIIAYYHLRRNFKAFIKQTYNYAVARGLLVRKGYRKINWRYPSTYWFIPVVFFGYNVFFLLYTFFLGFHIVIVMPMLIYWVSALIVSIKIVIREKTLIGLSLPPLYFIFHNILGLGLLSGLLFGKKAFHV